MEEKNNRPENMEDWNIEEYKAAYKAEKKKNVILSGRLADAVAQAEEKERQIRRIKDNPL